MSLKASDRAIACFSERFGQAPTRVASAPGRVNLIGEHTDYSDGFVLPMAIDARTTVAARPRIDRTITLYSAAFDESIALDLTSPVVPRGRHWSNYAAGVVAGIQVMGVTVPGLDVVIESDVPIGAGLSSSAALEVAVATLVEAATGLTWDPREKARLCQRAEHEFAGVPTGIMDQLVAVLAKPGQAVKIDCRSLDVTYVDLTDPTVTVMIVNTNIRHDLADGAYAERRADCVEAARRLDVAALRDATREQLQQHADALGHQLFPRARHVVSENARVHAASEAARHRDWDRVGALMYDSHTSLRDDYAVSCFELDVLVEISQAIGRRGGVFGCRMTGGGFGGSVVCLVETIAAPGVANAIGNAYLERTGRTATALTSQPGGGADVFGLGA